MARLFRRRRGSEGFTLIELVVVMAIIAVIGGLLLPRISASAQAAKKGACKQNMLVAAAGLEAYKIEKGDYPPTTTDLTAYIKQYVGEDAAKCPESGIKYSWDKGNKKLTCSTHGLTYNAETGKFE